MAALDEYSGGARWGDSHWIAAHATWPLAHLLICDDRLILTTPLGAYDFPRVRIRRMSLRIGWFSRLLQTGAGSLRIEHEIAEYPPYVSFGTFNIKSLCERLSAAGFPLKT